MVCCVDIYANRCCVVLIDWDVSSWWKDVDVKAFFGSNITQFCLNIIDNLYSRTEYHLKLIHLPRNISAILKAAASPVLHAPCVVAHPFPVASPAK